MRSRDGSAEIFSREASRRAKPFGDEYIERMLSNSRQSLGRLFEKLIPVIRESAKTMLYRHRWQASGRNVQQELEDVIQDTAMSLLNDNGRVLRGWDPDLGLSLAGYVRLVAERQVITMLRSGKRNPWKESPSLGAALEQATRPGGHCLTAANLLSSAHDIEGQYASKEILTLLNSRFERQLSRLGQEIFVRLYIDENTVDEICEELGMSSDAVYAWKSRLIRHARLVFHKEESSRPS